LEKKKLPLMNKNVNNLKVHYKKIYFKIISWIFFAKKINWIVIRQWHSNLFIYKSFELWYFIYYECVNVWKNF
jgi:hypothetical protein